MIQLTDNRDMHAGKVYIESIGMPDARSIVTVCKFDGYVGNDNKPSFAWLLKFNQGVKTLHCNHCLYKIVGCIYEVQDNDRFVYELLNHNDMILTGKGDIQLLPYNEVLARKVEANVLLNCYDRQYIVKCLRAIRDNAVDGITML